MVVHLIRVALRNTTRNRRRTVLTMGTIVACVSLSIVVRGVIGAAQRAIVENVTKSLTGDLQLHPKGYTRSAAAMPLDRFFREGGEVEKALDRQSAPLRWARRVRFAGLLYANAERSSPFTAVGIDPEREVLVCPHLEDRFLVGGRFLAGRREREVLLSKSFADLLGVALGQRVILLGTTRFGSVSAVELEVVGLLEASIPTVDKKAIYVPLETAQEFLDLPGGYTEIAASAATLTESRRVYDALAAAARSGTVEAEVFFWTESAKVFDTIVGFQKMMVNVVTIVVFVIGIAAIFNTMLMAVMERTREIGTVRALGLRRKHVVLLLLVEAAIIGAAGAAIGAGAGALVNGLLGIRGLVFHPPGSLVPVVLNPTNDATTLIVVTALALATSLVAAAQPTALAARLRPTEALRRI